MYLLYVEYHGTYEFKKKECELSAVTKTVLEFFSDNVLTETR